MTAEQTERLKYVRAINSAIADAMEEDESVFLVGQDVSVGGVFTAYRGLADRFGADRVVDSPICEAGLVGLGVGAAATGCRPIVDIMFMDFMGIAMDQIVNQAAKMKYMFGGGVTLPLTICTMAGAGNSNAAQHSQNLEAWLCHVPGLKVVMPSGPYEAKGLLTAAIRDDNPTIVVFDKNSLGRSADVPVGRYELEIGRAAVCREGSDVSIVTYGRQVHESIAAAEVLAESGVSAEVIDIRTPSPLDTDTIVTSAKKTNRVVVVHEAVRFGGFGGEIAAQVQELAFDHLDAPVVRVGAPFSPVPFSPELEEAYVPDRNWIVDAAQSVLVGKY